ncbi:MAG: DUF1684 domain-containing protein [Balneolaceae bacterium]
MINRTKLLCLISVFVFFAACSPDQPGEAPVPDNYAEEINDWKEYRVMRLTEPTGWLRLADLIWLEEGENSFGSGEERDIRFEVGGMPEMAGTFIQEGDTIRMEVAEGVMITHEGETVRDMVIFDGENRPRIEYEDLIWFVDTRDGVHGIRIYNRDTPEADRFEGFPFYPLDPEWHLEARLVPWPEERTIEVINVLGQTIQRETPGRVEFTVDGELQTLDAFESDSGLFLILADHTNRTETFQGGRYMYIPFPDENNMTVIDFNKAYNPPCAFSTMTTCQLPPPQNRLDVAIEAGEKRPVGWQGLDLSAE